MYKCYGIPMAKRQYPEQKIQIACADYLKWLEKLTGKFIFHHSPNGGKRSKSAGALFKAMGTRAGFPDIILLMEGGKTLFYELKYKGTYLNENQKIFHPELERLGFHIETITAESPAHAVEQLAKSLRENGIPEAK